MHFDTGQDFHERISNVFHLTLAVPLLPMGYVYLEREHNDWVPQWQGEILLYLSIVTIAIILAGMGISNYKKSIAKILALEGLPHKFTALFTAYRSFYLINLAAAVLVMVGYYLTGSWVLFVFYVIQLLVLSILRPCPDRYIRDLQLPKVQADQLRRKELQIHAPPE